VQVKPIGIIALGYPAEKPERFERKELPCSLRKYDRTKRVAV
jgi:nitroreductase